MVGPILSPFFNVISQIDYISSMDCDKVVGCIPGRMIEMSAKCVERKRRRELWKSGRGIKPFNG